MIDSLRAFRSAPIAYGPGLAVAASFGAACGAFVAAMLVLAVKLEIRDSDVRRLRAKRISAAAQGAVRTGRN